MNKVVTIGDKERRLQEKRVEFGGKQCRQVLNEHGFEEALFDAVTLEEIEVPGRPLTNAAVREKDDKKDGGRP